MYLPDKRDDSNFGDVSLQLLPGSSKDLLLPLGQVVWFFSLRPRIFAPRRSNVEGLPGTEGKRGPKSNSLCSRTRTLNATRGDEDGAKLKLTFQ